MLVRYRSHRTKEVASRANLVQTCSFDYARLDGTTAWVRKWGFAPYPTRYKTIEDYMVKRFFTILIVSIILIFTLIMAVYYGYWTSLI